MKKLLATAVIAALCATLAFAGDKFVINENSGVVGYYTFEEDIDDSLEVIDHSGNDITVYTSALDGSELDEGYEGRGLYFNGEDEYITLDPSCLDGNGFTFCAWVNPESWRVWTRILDIGNQREDLWIGMDWETGKLRMDVLGAAATAGSVTLFAPLPPVDEWTHVAATIGKGAARLYINGKLVQRLPCPITPEHLAQNVQGIYVGASNWSDPLFRGVMDNVLVANRVLSGKEIAAVYRGVVAFDDDE